MRLFSLTFAVLLSLVSACQLQAGVVSNGSFDNGDFSGADSNNAKTLGVGSTLITDWTVITNPIVWINSPTNGFGNLPGSDGSKFLDLTSYADNGAFGGVSQTLTTVVGVRYKITFDVGAAQGPVSSESKVRVQVGGGALLDAIASGLATTATPNWTTYTGYFTATSSSTLLTLLGIKASGPTGGGGQPSYIGLDNVKVESSSEVPEPACCFLIVAAAVPFRRSIKKAMTKKV